jgi:SagB-type dehydrogenase family enzyme
VTDSREAVRAYHARTKHAPGRYARSLGYLDWDTQPDPFRRFVGAPTVALDVVPPNGAPKYPELFVGAREPAPLSRASISQMLFDSLALSAEKAAGTNRWWLRVNPSSGNLHPTEGYLVLPAVEGIAQAPAVHHYAPRAHALERLGAVDGFADGTFWVGLTSIHWREAWKYGERAYRYCQHDVGHAIAAVSLAAALLGWRVRQVPIEDAALAALLGIDAQTGPEREHPDVLLAVEVVPAEGPVWVPSPGAPHGFETNTLSREHHPWPVIDDVAAAAERLDASAIESSGRVVHALPEHDDAPDARRVIRTRRSAVAMDGRTGITRDAFYEMLLRTCAGEGHRPFDVLPWSQRVHLALFVHRVQGLDPGLYLLLRRPDAIEPWREEHPDLDWAKPEGCPASLDLFRLRVGDAGEVAAAISCGQAIAADGAFAVAMIAELEDALEEHGAWFYRALHWEAGAIGQVLYLEAEAAGIRATGIGCFFDDLTHEILGLDGSRRATLYHFTVGGPVEDDRIQTTDPYASRTG